MKIRSDFVSNSSSSSFILYDSPIFDFFRITKKVLNDAITDLIGKDYIDDYKQNALKRYKEHPEYIDEKVTKYGIESACGPYWIYDMTIKSDKTEALDRFGILLDDWDSRLACLYDNGNLGRTEGYSNYKKICHLINEIYHLENYSENVKTEKDIKELTAWIKTVERQPNGCFGYSVPAPDFVGKLLLDIRKRCGIVTNKEILQQSCSRFFVHFDDNEIWNLKGCIDAGKKDPLYENPRTDYEKKHNEEVKNSLFESESYTKERIFEILWNYLVKKNIINPNEDAFLRSAYPLDKYEKKLKEEQPDNYKDIEYDTYNRKNLSYHDLVDELLAFVGHEG